MIAVQRNVYNMAPLDLRHRTRLPQPVAHRRRQSVVPQTSGSLPAIDLERRPTAQHRHGNGRPADVSRIPIPKLVTEANERLRPQTTSGTTHTRHKVSGKGHLLQKLHTMSLGRTEDEARFTRFHPLPAIGNPSASAAQQQLDVSTKNPLSDSPSSDLDTCEEFEISGHNSGRPNSNDDGACACEGQLFKMTGRECVEAYGDGQNLDMSRGGDMENTDIERTMFSHEKPLVRSRTYDILPVGEEDHNCTFTEMSLQRETDNISDIVQDVCVDKQAYCSTPGILFAIRTPAGNQIYGYFHESDALQQVMDFACSMTGESYEEYKLTHVDNNATNYLDLNQTIAETKLKNRSLLSIIE